MLCAPTAVSQALEAHAQEQEARGQDKLSTEPSPSSVSAVATTATAPDAAQANVIADLRRELAASQETVTRLQAQEAEIHALLDMATSELQSHADDHHDQEKEVASLRAQVKALQAAAAESASSGGRTFVADSPVVEIIPDEETGRAGSTQPRQPPVPNLRKLSTHYGISEEEVIAFQKYQARMAKVASMFGCQPDPIGTCPKYNHTRAHTDSFGRVWSLDMVDV